MGCDVDSDGGLSDGIEEPRGSFIEKITSV